MVPVFFFGGVLLPFLFLPFCLGPALSDDAGQGWGLWQVGMGTLHWPWGSGGDVQNQGQEVGVGMAEG
jgi:hypothetical protein